jgi:hypothetical protein
MATVYVKKTGNNSNAGTRASPVLDIARAAGIVADSNDNDSEIIIMDDGTYSEGGIGQDNPTVTETGLTIMAETGSDGLPVVSPVIQGSGSGNTQSYAFFCAEGWTIKGLTFQNYDLANSTDNAVITNRSPGNDDDGITVEQCTFRHITGSCITFSRGSYLPKRHLVKSNTFYDITTKSSQKDMIIISDGTVTRKATVVNNVFYDWQPQEAGATFIMGGSTNSQLPQIIISHNTFGTSSVEANTGGSTTRAQYGVNAPLSKFEYNIIFEQTMAGTNSSFAQIDSGEANYNIYYNVAGASSHAPFGRASAPTSSNGNQEINPQLKGPLVGDSANYRLGGTNSPAFDAAIGSANVTTDRTARSRATLDISALNTGIFDIGAYELTGLYSVEQPDTLPQIGGDFVINRIPNADNQYKRGLSEGNSQILGNDVEQVPLTTAINGAVPSFIRKRPTANTQETGKKG